MIMKIMFRFMLSEMAETNRKIDDRNKHKDVC